MSPTDHTKEQRLKNDKYDMALEVSQATERGGYLMSVYSIVHGAEEIWKFRSQQV